LLQKPQPRSHHICPIYFRTQPSFQNTQFNQGRKNNDTKYVNLNTYH
jgi:hypothetical protein